MVQTTIIFLLEDVLKINVNGLDTIQGVTNIIKTLNVEKGIQKKDYN